MPSIFKEDKGIVGSLLAIPGSAIGAIGEGISALPQLGGKLAQTAFGFGEGIMDLALDAIDEDIYTSRFETDLAKALEMGLEGDALVAYAAHRQYPFGSMLIESGAATGRRIGELATAGRYDYGTPGIDYARAFREGDLGALLVEDVGNVILAGRATGAGNIVARGGGRVAAAGAPRLGQAISTTGRFIEEPIATTTRGAANVLGRTLPETGRAGRVATRATRVSQAEAPLRQIMGEIGDAYRTYNERQVTELTKQINEQQALLTEAQQAGRMDEVAGIQSTINELNQRRGKANAAAGLLAAGRRITRRGKIAEERALQQVSQQFNRMSTKGALPESVDTYRKRAAKLRQRAEKAESPAERQRLEAEAVVNENNAAMKEMFPEELSRGLEPYQEEAAIHVASGKARELLEQADNGTPINELVTNATDPFIDPSIAERGVTPTAAGVQAAIDFLRSQRGETVSLGQAQLFSIGAFYALLKQYSDLVTNLMRRGFGMPEGPAPFYWSQTFPIPQQVLAALDSKYRGIAPDVLRQLDDSSATVILEAINNGILDEGFLEDLGIDPTTSDGLFRLLVKQGLDQIAKGNTQPVPYMVAFTAMQLSYNSLRRIAPNLMLDADIYPAIMRPAIITRRQAVRAATGEEVLGLADQLMNLARDFPDLIDNRIIEAIRRDIGAAIDPRRRIEQKTLTRLTDRLATIKRVAEDRMTKLRQNAENLSVEERTLSSQLIELQTSIGAVEATLRTIAAQEPGMSPRLVEAQQRLVDTQAEVQALQAEKAQLQAEDRAAREAESARLQPLTERLTAEEGRLAEVNSREAALLQELAEAERVVAQLDADLNLVPKALEDPAALQEDFELVTRLESQIDVDAQARQARAEAIATAEAEVQMLLDEVLRFMGPEKLKRRGTEKDTAGRRRDEATLAQEDVMGALWPLGPKSGRIFKAFYREFTADGPSYLTADQFSTDAYYRNVTPDASQDTFLTSVATVYVRLYEARQRLKEARKSTASYRGDVLTQDLLYDAEVGDLGRTGLTSQQVTRAIELQDPVVLNDLIDRRKAAVKKVDDLRRRADELGRERTRVARDVGVAEGAIPRLAPASRSPRLGEIDARLQELVGEQRNAARRLRFAERAEPKEAARAQAAQERAALQGVGRIRRPAPGAEGPALGEMQAGARRTADTSVAQLNAQQERNVARLQQVRRNILAQDELARAAETPSPEQIARLKQEMPLGPQLFGAGEQPLYIPAGPPRSFYPGRSYELGIRGEGAAPQTRLGATQQRTTGTFVLTASAMAQRIQEVIGQMYRNSVIEEIIRDPGLTQSTKSLLGLETLDDIRARAETAVDQQGILRNTPEFEQAVQRTFGTEVIREITKRGYDIATPVTVNPETLTHAPVGDLTLEARPVNIDENTLVMRQGIRERLVAEYERKGVREVPGAIEKILDGIGNLTSRWKSHILPLSLRWQIGDAVGIVLFAWIRGDLPPGQLASRIKQAAEMLRADDPRIGSILFSDVLGAPFDNPVAAALFGNGLQGRGLTTQDIGFLDRMSERPTGMRADQGRFRRYDAFRAKAFRLNETINSMGRLAVAIDFLDKALTEQGRSLDEINGPGSLNDPVIDKAVKDAVDATNETLGAFSDLNPWEKQVMRQVFPFWSWIKFINKAAYELSFDSPDRVLFYAHLGSLAADPDDSGLSDWLRGKTPIFGSLVDLNFMNPYQDALLLQGNPITDTAETFTSLSPAIEVPRKIAGELTYAATGRQFPLLSVASRPGYLEGRPGTTTRGVGDVLGGAAYIGIRGLVPIARNIFDVLPEGTIPGTDIATGPVQRFGQGSRRTTGAYAEPRLSPIAGRAGAVLRTFGIPAPLISQEIAQRQARDQRQRDVAARLRRIRERQRAGG